MNARLAVPLLLCIVLAACQSTDNQHVKAAPTLLNDSLFPSYTLFPVESSDEIFYLDEDAQFFCRKGSLRKKYPAKECKRVSKSNFRSF